MSCGSVRLELSSGISIVKAIKVIANANTASLNEITCSNLIPGVNAFADKSNNSN
jgi:hypothetical protein